MYEIPKIIHYCWFGKGEKSPLILRCMASWKKFFPDYEIREWNEDNFDITQNSYIQEAYSCKKWAFVSDFVRLVAVYEYGGIYFDTDVEVIKNFEHILQAGGYLGFENATNEKNKKKVATGLGFAAHKGDKIILAMLNDYKNINFLNKGKMDLIPCPERNTNVLNKMGLKTDGSLQRLGDITIYPFEYFCGFDLANSHPLITKNTYTIHHYTASWCDKMSWRLRFKYGVVVKLLQKILGYELYDKIKLKTKNRE